MISFSWIANGGSTKEIPEFEEKNRVSSYRGNLSKMRRSNNILAPQWGEIYLYFIIYKIIYYFIY